LTGGDHITARQMYGKVRDVQALALIGYDHQPPPPRFRRRRSAVATA
jgi:phage/plasmid-associated DNA primase